MTNREEHWERTARTIVEEKKIAERRKMFKRAKAFQPVNAPTKADQLDAKIALISLAAKDLSLCDELPLDAEMAIGRLMEAIEATPDRCWVELQGSAE